MRKVLAPRWWIGHVLVVVAVLVMLRLGLWQLHRAESSNGGVQNIAYALQWPAFALFAIVMWIKTLHEEVRGTRRRGEGTRVDPRDLPADVVSQRDGVRIGVTTTVVPVDEDDDEVRAYNEHLARLNARTARR